MSDKKTILNSIAAVARQLGRTPSLLEFVALSGISKYSVLLILPRWNEAVRATGLEPVRLKVRPEDEELLKDWGQTVRKSRAIPTKYAYRRKGKYDPRTLEERFGGWASVPRAFRRLAISKREWADVVALLLPACIARASRSREERRRSCDNPASSIPPKKVQHAPLKDRATCGNPMHLPGFRHEPVNEQGVILLFGMVAEELGYMVETVQSGFPDCEAKRQIAPNRWQRVNIEFEFERRNFRDHGHPVSGCDVIVCWRHNWDECPDHIEILELCTRIKSLANSESAGHFTHSHTGAPLPASTASHHARGDSEMPPLRQQRPEPSWVDDAAADRMRRRA